MADTPKAKTPPSRAAAARPRFARAKVEPVPKTKPATKAPAGPAGDRSLAAMRRLLADLDRALALTSKARTGLLAEIAKAEKGSLH